MMMMTMTMMMMMMMIDDDVDDDDDDRCKFVAVLQENVMDVKLEEYAVEAAQKAVDLCRAELYRLLVY